MSTENNEKIRIIDLDSGDSSVSMTDTNNALMVDSNSTGSKKLSLFAVLEKVIAYIKGRPSRVLPDSNPNQVLSTDENNIVKWKDPTTQVNADWDSTQGVSQILHKPDLSVYATTDALDTARTTLSNSISEEASDRMSDVSSLRSDLSSESSARSEADADINAALTAEINARTSSDTALQSALESKANASELTVTPGTGDNADKATIQLKDGVSATVLTEHQSIPEQKQADWNESDSSKLDFIKNKPTNLSDFTNDIGFITNASIEGKADKSEMSITEGTDTATIQLKSGTSATVLTQHQDISDKADKATTYTKTEIDTALSGKAAAEHNHDNRYYTETEVDTALDNKADKATTLAGYGITDAKIANGTITLGSQTITPVVASDIEGKANKSELTVTPGTDVDADKTTIQLKDGVSATVLTKHQTIPEQKQADWNESDSSKLDFIKNKPTNLVQDASYVHTDNNFTDTLKDKLDNIEAGAQVNVKPDWSAAAGSAAEILNKPTIPTSQVTVIFLDYNLGDDSNDGLTPLTQVQTLTKAISILMKHKNSVIYIKNGGSYNLNGAEAAHILSMDSEDQYTILKSDLSIYCDTYLNLTFSDDTSSIDVVKIRGDIKIHANGILNLSRIDFGGSNGDGTENGHIDISSENAIHINDDGSNSIPLPVFRSRFINIESVAIISMKYLQIQSDRTMASVKFHTIKGDIELHYSNIHCYDLSLTTENTSYTSPSGGNVAGATITLAYTGNETIDVVSELKVHCWCFYCIATIGLNCGKFLVNADQAEISNITAKSGVKVYCDYWLKIDGAITSDEFIELTAERGSLSLYNDSTPSAQYFFDSYSVNIKAGLMQYSPVNGGFPAIRGKIVRINTYSPEGTTYIPDIVGRKVIIDSKSNVEINNITPTNDPSNKTVHISCLNLKFENSSKKIGISTYNNSKYYFDFLDIRARRFDIANGSNEILAYAIYIKTTGIDKNASYGDLQIDMGAYVSAMVLKIDCTSLDIGISGFICVGANSNANPKVADLDWTSNDINTETRYSADIHAATYHAASPSSKLLCLCPYGNQKSGQFAHIDIGVIDYGSTNADRAYIIPVVFHGYNGAGNTPNTFNGDLAGRIGGIYIDGQLRLYPWDNFVMLGFVNSAAVGQTASINLPLDNNGNIQGTGKITASFDHSLYREFYVFPAPGMPTSLDLNDGLSSATAVGTMTGLLRAMSKTEISAYPIIIHILGGTGTTFVLDLGKVIEYNTTANGPVTMFDIQGNANIDTVVTNIPSRVSVLSVHDFRHLYLSPSKVTSNGVSVRNGCIFAYNINGRIEYVNTDCETSSIWHSILNLESCEDIKITGIAADTVRAKCDGTIDFNNSRWNSGCDIVLESKFYARFNKDDDNAPVVDATYSGIGVEIISDSVEADLTKFKMTGCSVRIKATNMATATLSARRGFYGGNGISVDAETTYIESVISTEEALPDPIAPSGLSVSSDAIHLTSKNNDGEATALPFFHCSFVATKEIVLDCRKFSIDYGYKRRSAISASVLGNVYNEASFISAPEIKPFYPNFSVEVPDTYVDNSAIEFINSNVIVNIGILDTELRFSTAGLFSDETYKMREINATLNIGRITKHGKISGYNAYDSSYANPINFNLISSIGMVERDSTAWYAYYNDGTSGQADNDPAKHTNFKFIAHVMHEGTSSVTQSYTGANTLWQVVCDDKPQNNLPAAPSSNGNYILTCTMNNGTPTYSWITMNTTTV